MAKIKLTKNELKAQRDANRLYRRFLPTLQLKKRQLQVEMKQIEVRLAEKRAEERKIREGLASWVKMFSEEVPSDVFSKVKDIETVVGNIAGVDIPVLKEVRFVMGDVDLFSTPTWVDDASRVLETLMRIRAEQVVLTEQMNRISEELLVTSQRVNLFEKVKIPETKNNIRVIQIFLGDMQTAGVARAKLAKKQLTVSEVAV